MQSPFARVKVEMPRRRSRIEQMLDGQLEASVKLGAGGQGELIGHGLGQQAGDFGGVWAPGVGLDALESGCPFALRVS